MEQFRKGRRLIALCNKKIQEVQSRLVRLNAERISMLQQIESCDAEIEQLTLILNSHNFAGVFLTRADIFNQRRHNAVLLHQRLQARMERTMHLEDMIEIEHEIELGQRQLAVLKRKEMKFFRWTAQSRQHWLARQDAASEDEIQEVSTTVHVDR